MVVLWAAGCGGAHVVVEEERGGGHAAPPVEVVDGTMAVAVAESPGASPMAVAVAPCSSPADAGAYALPEWVMLDRASATEGWPAGPPADLLEAQIAATPTTDERRASLRLALARTYVRDGDRPAAIRVLAQLIQEAPDAADMDTVLFTLGWLLGEMGQADRARQVFFRLVRAHPDSPWVPRAYLVFADFYFVAGDLSAATQFYARVLELPAAQNRVHDYARYRLAASHARQGDVSGARRLLEQLAADLRADATLPDRDALAAAAERDACGLPR